MTTLPPSSILFSHSKIRSRFTGCGKTLEETYAEIKNGSLSGMISLQTSTHSRLRRRAHAFCSTAASLPHIRVWYDGNVYVSENNRRLFVFKRLEKEV
jgi:hypothetical protein